MWRTVFDLARKKEKLIQLEQETNREDFWQNREHARQIGEEIKDIKNQITVWKILLEILAH